jgi:hypothetical protein
MRPPGPRRTGSTCARAQTKQAASPVTRLRGTEPLIGRQVFWLTALREVRAAFPRWHRSGLDIAWNSGRSQQRPCAGFAPASLFVARRENGRTCQLEISLGCWGRTSSTHDTSASRSTAIGSMPQGLWRSVGGPSIASSTGTVWPPCAAAVGKRSAGVRPECGLPGECPLMMDLSRICSR